MSARVLLRAFARNL